MHTQRCSWQQSKHSSLLVWRCYNWDSRTKAITTKPQLYFIQPCLLTCHFDLILWQRSLSVWCFSAFSCQLSDVEVFWKWSLFTTKIQHSRRVTLITKGIRVTAALWRIVAMVVVYFKLSWLKPKAVWKMAIWNLKANLSKFTVYF